MTRHNLIKSAIITAVVLIAPLFAKFTISTFLWSWFDFVAAGVVIFLASLFFEVASNKSESLFYKTAIGVTILTCFMLFWITSAVGIIGSEDNPINMLYLLVIATGTVGAIFSKLRPTGMSITLFIMAFIQLLIPVVGLITGTNFKDDPEAVGFVGIMFINAGFSALFIIAGRLFAKT